MTGTPVPGAAPRVPGGGRVAEAPVRATRTSRRGAPRALLDDGTCALYAAGDHELLLTVWTDPVLDRPVLFCPWASPPADVPSFPLAALRAAGKVHWPGVTSLLVRLEGEGSPAGPGWRRDRIMLARVRPSPEPPAGTAGVTVRPAGVEDRVPVLGMLLAALRTGYARHAEGSGPAIERALREVYARDLAAGTLRALVALVDGEVAGHAVYRPRAHDDVTGAPHVELVDTYVLPGFGGTGLARRLAGHVEAEAAALGLPLRGEVICDPGGAWQVLHGNLRRAGWTPAWTMWEAPLAVQGGAREAGEGVGE